MESGVPNNNTAAASADVWRARADDAMATVAGVLTDAPFGPAAEAIQDYRDQLAAVEALLIAKRKQAGHSDRSNEGIIKSSGRVSKGEARRRSKRADAVEKNPSLATKLTTGQLSTEKVDLIADASARTEGAAATDSELITDVSNANPDQAKAIVRKFVDEHTDPGDRNTRYAWQRKRRKIYRTITTSGMSALILEGDNHSIDAALRTIRKRADQLYNEEGGRDIARSDHERTHDQRMFDAAVSQLTGVATSSTEGSKGSESSTGASADGAARAPEPTSGTTAPVRPPNRPGERPIMVFRGNLGDITSDPDTIRDWECELIGTGVVPRAVAEYYCCISDHAAQLVSGVGEVLWHGRTKRMVTRGQWIALVIRDGGCCVCGLDQMYCEAHHLVPWNAPAKGETNIDALALVCVDCHHRIHENELTLYYDPVVRKWRMRPATFDEIAPVGKAPRARPPSLPTPDRQPTADAAHQQASASFGERVRRLDQLTTREIQLEAKTMLFRSSEPSGSKLADSMLSVNAM